MVKCIDSGSTLLNLALTGTLHGGFPLGRISNIVGDRSAGKTLLAIEAAGAFLRQNNKALLYYLETESAFDLSYAENLGLQVKKVNFVKCKTIEDFFIVFDGIYKKLRKDDECLLILDSLDALSTEDLEKKGSSVATYGVSLPKKLSDFFKLNVSKIEEKKIHFMIISQVRENIGGGLFSEKYKRSGGKALDFYISHSIWVAVVEKLKSSLTNKINGLKIIAKIKKNKFAVPFRDVTYDSFFGYGIDDITSCINFLTHAERLKFYEEKKIIKAPGGYFYIKGKDEKYRLKDFVLLFENTEMYSFLKNEVKLVWDNIERQSVVSGRKKKGSF